MFANLACRTHIMIENGTSGQVLLIRFLVNIIVRNHPVFFFHSILIVIMTCRLQAAHEADTVLTTHHQVT